MELRHLRSFVTVAEELHFGRAAERLHIAQSPLSQQIQRLERQVGVALFDRNRRKVELTEAGQAMLGHAREALAQADLAANAARGAAAGQAGTLRVGFLASAALELLPMIVPPWREVAPAASLEFVEGSSGEHIAGVRGRRLDVAFVRPPQPGDDLVVDEVWHEPLVAVVPARSSLARRKSLRLKDLDGQPFVLFPRESAPDFHDHLVDACRRAGFVPDVVHECSAMPTVVGVVATGLGVSLVPQSISRIALETVAYLPLDDADMHARIAMVTAADNARPLVSGFTASVRRTLDSGTVSGWQTTGEYDGRYA
jgi:DNA-binding transcriptional LysR family regulator